MDGPCTELVALALAHPWRLAGIYILAQIVSGIAEAATTDWIRARRARRARQEEQR